MRKLKRVKGLGENKKKQGHMVDTSKLADNIKFQRAKDEDPAYKRKVKKVKVEDFVDEQRQREDQSIGIY